MPNITTNHAITYTNMIKTMVSVTVLTEVMMMMIISNAAADDDDDADN